VVENGIHDDGVEAVDGSCIEHRVVADVSGDAVTADHKLRGFVIPSV